MMAHVTQSTGRNVSGGRTDAEVDERPAELDELDGLGAIGKAAVDAEDDRIAEVVVVEDTEDTEDTAPPSAKDPEPEGDPDATVTFPKVAPPSSAAETLPVVRPPVVTETPAAPPAVPAKESAVPAKEEASPDGPDTPPPAAETASPSPVQEQVSLLEPESATPVSLLPPSVAPPPSAAPSPPDPSPPATPSPAAPPPETMRIGQPPTAKDAVAHATPVLLPHKPGAPGARLRAWALRLLDSAPIWVPPVLTVEGLVMYIAAMRLPPGPMRGVDLEQLDGLGLISVLPGAAFAGILMLIVSFFITVAQNTDRKGLLLFQLATIVFALHGAAALVESEPRFHTAWVHAGFVEYISRTGEALPGLDARFSWPGFFALVSFVTQAAGVDDLTLILRWTPLLSNLLYLLPFVMVLRLVVATTRARWFAALLFILVQWIGQDYFSPQGFTYALYLAFVAILLRWFGRVEPRRVPIPAKGRIRRLLARLDRLTPGELVGDPPGLADRVIMLILLIALFTAVTAAHQITPFMMLGTLTGLILLRRTSLSLALPFFLGLIVLAWINYQATPYWSNNLDNIFGGIGRIFDNLQENTGARLEGTDPEHALVLKVRLGICGVVLALAVTGLIRRLRRGVGDRAALILLCVPTLALGLQSYGGEIGLRIYMFALPGACILAAYAFFPNLPAGTSNPGEETVPFRRRNLRFHPSTTRRVSLALAVAVAVALFPAFLIARYGNEKFERVTPGEVAAMRYVYDHDEPNARLLYLVPIVGVEITPNIPWRERDIETVEYLETLAPKDPTALSTLISHIRLRGPNTYFVMTRGQAYYLELNHGYPEGWGERFRAALDASPDLKRVYGNADAAVYTLRTFPKGPLDVRSPTFELVGDPSTTWTPYGLAGLALAWGGLFTYEIMRLRGPGRPSRARRRVLIVGAVGFVVAIVVIVERFVVLGVPPS